MPWTTLQSLGTLSQISHFLPPQWYSDISSPVKFQIQSNRRQRVKISSKNFLMFPCPWWPTFPPPAKTLPSFLSYLFYFLLQLYPSPLLLHIISPSSVGVLSPGSYTSKLQFDAHLNSESAMVCLFYSQYLSFVLCFTSLTESLLLGNPTKDAYACAQQSPCL